MDRRRFLRSALALGAIAPVLPFLPAPSRTYIYAAPKPMPVQKLVYWNSWPADYASEDVLFANRDVARRINDSFINGPRYVRAKITVGHQYEPSQATLEGSDDGREWRS